MIDPDYIPRSVHVSVRILLHCLINLSSSICEVKRTFPNVVVVALLVYESLDYPLRNQVAVRSLQFVKTFAEYIKIVANNGDAIFVVR